MFIEIPTSEPDTQIDFEAIKSGINISSVLAQYAPVPAKRRGSIYRMACPLHQGENLTCFKVNEQEGSWWCFKCHKGGDVISLVAHFENCKNLEAARKLADNFRIYARTNSFQQMMRTTQRKMESWRERQDAPPPLAEGDVPETIELFKYRDFTKDTIDHFGIRLIPGIEWGSGIYIPIKTPQGEVVGYSIRQHEQHKPKYLNSQGLKKQGIMFGLHENKDAIRAKGRVVLVEGQFDCMSMWQRGYEETVSIMGSNLSVHQALVLARHTGKLILFLDGDEAGRKGAQQIAERYGSAFEIEVWNLPEGIDPATADLAEYN